MRSIRKNRTIGSTTSNEQSPGDERTVCNARGVAPARDCSASACAAAGYFGSLLSSCLHCLSEARRTRNRNSAMTPNAPSMMAICVHRRDWNCSIMSIPPWQQASGSANRGPFENRDAPLRANRNTRIGELPPHRIHWAWRWCVAAWSVLLLLHSLQSSRKSNLVQEIIDWL